MLKLKSSDLHEGMKFSAPVFFDDGKNMFLSERKPIKNFHLAVLKNWNIPFVITHGKEILCDDCFEELEEMEELEDLEEIGDENGTEAIDSEKNAFSNYVKSISNMEKVFKVYKAGQTFDKNLIEETSNQVLQLVESDSTYAISFVVSKKINAMSYAIAAVNTSIISALMAMQLNFPQRNLLQLIVAALLHDLGMLTVPEFILNKKGKLTLDEFDQLKMHPVKAARYVTDALLFPRAIANILLQHHERWDGNGYPEGRKENMIDVSARLISVADAFEAMISEKTYRNSMIAYEAVKNLLSDKQKKFDPMVLKVFIKTIGVYPVGSFVLLNDSSIAKVVEGDPDSPFLPSVKIINNKTANSSIIGQIIRLKDQKNFFIVRALDPKEITTSA